MSNQRQIPFLHGQRRTDGTTAWHWKPSPRLRKLGWCNRALGTDADQALLAALELNRQLAEWQEGAHPGQHQAPPRRRTFGDVVDAFQQSPDWSALKPATRREYRSRLKFLRSWALDGTLPLDALDVAMVRDLRSALLAPLAPCAAHPDGRPASLHVAGAVLRVLRLTLNWCIAQGWIVHNPTHAIKIRQAAPRITALQEDQIAAVAAQANALGYPTVALGFTLGLWTMQRQSDLLGLNQMAWREVDNCAAADRAVLAGPAGCASHGKVMGFRIQQNKTGAWVDCPVPPFLHAAIEAAFQRSQWLLPDDDKLDRACPDFLFRRRARKALDAAGLQHAEFRDCRRSGMLLLKDLGCEMPGITAISGHMILGKRSILDTYMPGNTRGACAAMAHALRTRAARQLLEKEA